MSKNKNPKTKYYAVRKGFRPGIYTLYAEYIKQVNGYSGAEHMSFDNKQAALNFVYGEFSTSDSTSLYISGKYESHPGFLRMRYYLYGDNRFIKDDIAVPAIEFIVDDKSHSEIGNDVAMIMALEKGFHDAIEAGVAIKQVYYENFNMLDSLQNFKVPQNPYEERLVEDIQKIRKVMPSLEFRKKEEINSGPLSKMRY